MGGVQKYARCRSMRGEVQKYSRRGAEVCVCVRSGVVPLCTMLVSP